MAQLENTNAIVRNCSGSKLWYDQACLEIIATESISFLRQYEECQGCKLLPKEPLNGSWSYVLDTKSPVRYAIENAHGQICNGSYQYLEYGHYRINLTEVTKQQCTPRITVEPGDAFLPLLIAVLILLSMAMLWFLVKEIGTRMNAGKFYARYFARKDKELGSVTGAPTTEASVPRSPTRSRVRSLDTFRGLTVAMMRLASFQLFVNDGGGGYDIFAHSIWNGLTVADVVFPWFAFAMGQALVLSLNARLRTSLPRLTALQQMARRFLLMAMLGVVIGSTDNSWYTVRLPGVLQRLATMYFIVGALECAFMRTAQNITPGRSLFRDIAASWQQWLVTLSLVAVQIYVTLAVAAPGCPRGYAGPGGLHLSAEGRNLTNCTGGIAAYIDRMVLGEGHLSTYSKAYDVLYRTTIFHDCEGLWGTLSGLLVVQAGAHATRIMLAYDHARARMMRWVIWSLVFGVTGGALCMFSRDGGLIPINKYLWSVSFCLATAAMAYMAQAVLYYIVDLKMKWSGRPLYYAGENALFFYVASSLLRPKFPFHIAIWAPTHAQLLAANAFSVLLWFAVAITLHRKRIFITL